MALTKTDKDEIRKIAKKTIKEVIEDEIYRYMKKHYYSLYNKSASWRIK